jgi:hypothetical protein
MFGFVGDERLISPMALCDAEDDGAVCQADGEPAVVLARKHGEGAEIHHAEGHPIVIGIRLGRLDPRRARRFGITDVNPYDGVQGDARLEVVFGHDEVVGKPDGPLGLGRSRRNLSRFDEDRHLVARSRPGRPFVGRTAEVQGVLQPVHSLEAARLHSPPGPI